MKELPSSRCSRCDHVSCPPARHCSVGCLGAEQVATTIPPVGTLYSSSTIHVAHAIFGAPYTVGYVDLDAGPRLFGHLPGPDAAVMGDRVVVTVDYAARGEEGTLEVARFAPLITEEVDA